MVDIIENARARLVTRPKPRSRPKRPTKPDARLRGFLAIPAPAAALSAVLGCGASPSPGRNAADSDAGSSSSALEVPNTGRLPLETGLARAGRLPRPMSSRDVRLQAIPPGQAFPRIKPAPVRRIFASKGGTPTQSTPVNYVVHNGSLVAEYSAAGDATSNDSAASGGGITLGTAHLRLIFWGSSWNVPGDVNNPSADIVGQYVTDVVEDTPYLNEMPQYGFRFISAIDRTTVTSPDPPSSFIFQNASDLVWALISQGTFPDPSEASEVNLYVVFLPQNSNYDTAATGGGAHASAGVFDFEDGFTDHAYVAWVGYGNIDFITKVFSHELVESLSDPDTDPNSGGCCGWQMTGFRMGEEIGDACFNSNDRRTGLLTTHPMVEAYWSQALHSCVIPADNPIVLTAQSTVAQVQLNWNTVPGVLGFHLSMDSAPPWNLASARTSLIVVGAWAGNHSFKLCTDYSGGTVCSAAFTCVPATCDQVSANCGIAADGCGGTQDCGSCLAPQTCGGRGTRNTCECPASTVCSADGTCGSCPSGQTCDAFFCCLGDCSQIVCGGIFDSCGHFVACAPPCPPPPPPPPHRCPAGQIYCPPPVNKCQAACF